MGYSDDLEHTAALSELLDGWVRGWARRYVSRRNRQRKNGVNRAMRGGENSCLALKDLTCSQQEGAAKADG